MCTCTMTLNDKLNGVELSFSEKPTENILNMLKDKNIGSRWHNVKKVWYARQNEKTITLAKQLTEQEIKDIEQEQTQQNTTTSTTKKETVKVNNNLLPLFDRVQFTDDENSNLQKNLTTKDIAKFVREHVRSRFPECKISVTCGGYNSIYIHLKSSPYNRTEFNYNDYPDLDTREFNRLADEANKEINAIIDYCEKYLKSYKYCTCYDPYGDYGSSYNFYSNVRVDYDYAQTEQTEEHKTIIADFHKALEAKIKADAIEQEKVWEETRKQDAIRAEENKRIAEQEAINTEYINNNVSFVDLSENEQYLLVNCKFGKGNKQDKFKYYEKQAQDENDYYLNDIKIEREITFQTAEALNYYKDMLLRDFDFIGRLGGNYTDDPRINSMIDYNNMTKEERTTVKWNLTGIAVYCNNTLQFVIDPQGYNYARYVGIVDDAKREEINSSNNTNESETITPDRQTAQQLEDASFNIINDNGIMSDWQTNTDYKTALTNYIKESNIKLSKEIIQQISEESENLKIYLYRLLTEFNSVQNLFAEANIKDGDKVTIFGIGDMGMVSESRIKMHSVTNGKYAQYDDAVKTVFTPENKRKQYYTWYHSNKCFIVVDGWQTIPEEILWDVESKNGFTCRKSKYLSCDRQQIKDIKEYFTQNNINILVDHSNS